MDAFSDFCKYGMAAWVQRITPFVLTFRTLSISSVRWSTKYPGELVPALLISVVMPPITSEALAIMLEISPSEVTSAGLPKTGFDSDSKFLKAPSTAVSYTHLRAHET